ncbi:MAG: protein kinase, partial [Chloroflexota bacterium]
MSTVYLAHDPHFERDVAIKLLPLELLHQPTFRRRFEREAKVVAALDHPAIVPVYDFGEEDGQPFLVMRFMMGGSLMDRLKEGPLTIKEASAIINQLAPALDEVHAHGIVHRDLKPSNILFDNRNDPYISDFGTAKIHKAHTKLTETGGAVGTPAYMSPEQIQGDSELDGRSDIYSLGVILFEMLTGKHPYQTNTPIAVAVKHIFEPVPHILDMVPSLPIEIQEVIGHAMAKEKRERFVTAVAFANALSKIANTIETHTITPLRDELRRKCERHALIIHTTNYKDPILNQLVKHQIDVDYFAELLRQPKIGGFDDVKVLLNQPTDVIRRHISRFYADKQPDDFLLLYYIGHAAIGVRSRLYLTAVNSEHNLLRGTTIPSGFIADEMDSSESSHQIVIMDTHFSHALTSDKANVIGQTVNAGANFTRNNPNRIIITATDSTQYLWAEGKVEGQARPSQFTKHLIEGLESGQADIGNDGTISINEVFAFVYDRVIRNSVDQQIQIPRKWSPFGPQEEESVVLA